MSTKNVVVIGGGTGSVAVLSGLKQHDDVTVTALVNMSDDGGSTGILRDELNVLPAGDVRQCLIALSDESKLSEIMKYRFETGGLEGHSFGNILLAALEKTSGGFGSAVKLASEMLAIKGSVIPTVLESVTLCMDDGSAEITKSEHAIGHARFTNKRPKLWLEPNSQVNPEAAQAIENADLIVIAPGNLYGSLAPALIVSGLGEALARAEAPMAYVCNLTTKPGQTDDFTVSDFAAEIERFIGYDCLDYVLFDNSETLLGLIETTISTGEKHVSQGEKYNEKLTFIGTELVSQDVTTTYSAADKIATKRAGIKHDPQKVASSLIQILANKEPSI